jgi:hypothetical protein
MSIGTIRRSWIVLQAGEVAKKYGNSRVLDWLDLFGDD